jgi:hypothetical protein
MSNSDNVKLVVLPFLQRWEASSNQLTLRILLIPRDSFLVPFVPDNLDSPAFFPNADLKFTAKYLAGLHDGLPEPERGDKIGSITLPPSPSYATVFKSLVSTFKDKITTAPKRARNVNESPKSVRKHLPRSYRDATGYVSRPSDMFTTDNTYSCAMKHRRHQPLKKFEPKAFSPSWGELIASILRIPDFAAVAGLIRSQSVTLDSEFLVDGGYLWLEMDPQSRTAISVSDTSGVETYAARILPTTSSRDMFTPILFPVKSHSELTGDIHFDDIFREHDDYADGWAKAVHCAQQKYVAMISEGATEGRPIKDIGVRLGWDDEQVTIWADRHLNPASAQTGYDNFPHGIHGYRVDVFDTKANDWFSLASASGQFGIGQTPFGQIQQELGVEVHPTVSMDLIDQSTYWMPMFFTNWTQGSLVGPDERTMKLLGRHSPPPNVPAPSFPVVGKTDPRLQLRYGREYQFRVRLMDHTGGGPSLSAPTGALGPSPVCSLKFQRWIKPLAPRIVGEIPSLQIEQGDETAVDFIEVMRPLMFYPAVMYADYKHNGRDATTELLSMADEINNSPSDGTSVTEPGLPDPDVDQIEITVVVETLAQDPLGVDGDFMVLYTATRAFPADLHTPARVPLRWVPCDDVWDPDEGWLESKTHLAIPLARTVKLRITALCSNKPTPETPYFGADDVRRGPDIVFPLRKNAIDEPDLFVSNAVSHPINGFFLQPSLDCTGQLAAALGLRSKGTTLLAKEGKRVVFACTSSIMHVIGPDLGSLTFTSQPSLALQWIIVVRLTLRRDWSWDGFPPDAISLTRGTKLITTFAPNRNVNHAAFAGHEPDRSRTEICIIDVVDPKPAPGSLPTKLALQYKITSKFQGQTAIVDGPTTELAIDLPVTTPPRQTPQLASVGLAMSPYVHDDNYSSTSERSKMLWLEFAAPLEDPQDRYFCRVLKYGPDQLLMGEYFLGLSFPNGGVTGAPAEALLTDGPEPPIPIDPEPVRRIIPNQTADTAGLDAMQVLLPTTSPLHWMLPLPPGLTPSSLELFGFWTYEFRVGHWNDFSAPDNSQSRWSTAQGRFGPPLRVAGVQHPMPPLQCTVSRDGSTILVAAQSAQSVLDGRVLPKPKLPLTQVWFMLYVQAAQMDGSGERRNIMVARTKGVDGKVGRPDVRAAFGFKSYVPTLERYGLRENSPLSVLAVELYEQLDQVSDPLGGDLGRQRILRTSRLVGIPSSC